MNESICRWGILSTAEIGKKHWHAIHLAQNAQLVAVASRNIEKANQFIESCQSRVPMEDRPIALSTYDELLKRSDIDAIYIPLPTGVRKDWVIKAANAGKHVLCEKPCAINSDDLRKMIDACRLNNVQFMDGVMFMHTDRLKKMSDVALSSIGDIRRIHSHLAFRGDEEFLANNIRTCSQLEPHGCLGDLGWYTIRISLWAMQWELPTKVRARMITNVKRPGSENSVPMSLAAELDFKNVTAGFYCSFEDHVQQWAVVGGTKGFLRVDDFVLPYAQKPLSFEVHRPEFVVDQCQFDMCENTTQFTSLESGNNATDSPETKLVEQFSDLVLGGSTNEFWEQISLKTQLVLDACFESAINDSKTIIIPNPQL